MIYSRTLLVLSGLLLVTGARADLPASLDQAASQVARAPSQHLSLVTDLEAALKAGVAEQDLQSVMRLVVARKYSPANASAFVRQLAEVRREGLPGALVRDKILEGMAKNVSSESILSVTHQWWDALKDAASTVREVEGRGLKYDKAGEREMLINLGAGLRQRYGVKNALLKLALAAEKGERRPLSAGRLVAAGNLADLALLYNATPTQALELPVASLRAGYTAEQIQAVQRNVLDQLRQGVAVVDVVEGMRRVLIPAVSQPVGSPFGFPGQPSSGPWPGGSPGGSFPGSGPGGSPGGGFPGGNFPQGGGGGY